jgi:hypothetical protein
MWNFPNCIGALDGKHIAIKAPSNSGSLYFNYKGTHSIVLMALVNANYKFLYVDVGCNGRISDGGVFANCSLSTALENNKLNIPEGKPLSGQADPSPFVIVGDDAFPLKPYLLKPFPHKNVPGPNRVFNYRLSRARRIVENAFGIISVRFRVLRRPIELMPENVTKVVLSICALHNFLLSRKESTKIYAPSKTFDTDNNGEFIPGSWRTEGFPESSMHLFQRSNGVKNPCITAKQVRENFKNYFMSSEGEVPWQYKHI